MTPKNDSCKPLLPFKRKTTNNGKPTLRKLSYNKTISSSPFSIISRPKNSAATQGLSRYVFIYCRSTTTTTPTCFKKRSKIAELRKKGSIKLSSGSCFTAFLTHKSKWKQETHPESVTSDLKISFWTKKDLWKSQTFSHGPSKSPTTKNSLKTNPPTSLHKTCLSSKPQTSTTPKTPCPKSFPSDLPFSVRPTLPITSLCTAPLPGNLI